MPNRKNHSTSPVPGSKPEEREETARRRDQRHEGSVNLHRARVSKNEEWRSKNEPTDSASHKKEQD